MGILISDHNYQETLNICDRCYILYRGRIVEEGTAEKIYRSKKAQEAYLGQRSLLLRADGKVEEAQQVQKTLFETNEEQPN